jgi:DNA mismatch endonuclease (patch repair protein)
MRAIRRTDTKPEVALRRALHRQGYRFRKDYRLDLAEGRRVRPDIAFTARRVAVFVDGCFWHACPEHGGKPANNVWYWEPKLRKNVERDRAADAALSAAGWDVVRVWEHEPLEAAVTAVLAALTRSGQAGAVAGEDRPAGGGVPAVAGEDGPAGGAVPAAAGEDRPGVPAAAGTAGEEQQAG